MEGGVVMLACAGMSTMLVEPGPSMKLFFPSFARVWKYKGTGAETKGHKSL